MPYTVQFSIWSHVSHVTLTSDVKWTEATIMRGLKMRSSESCRKLLRD